MELSWENCDRDSNSIKLFNLTVNPYPIEIPGKVSIEVGIHNNQESMSPIKVRIYFYFFFL